MFKFVGAIISGVVSIIVSIYLLVYSPLYAASQDAAKKAEEVAEKLVKTQTEQSAVNTQILVTLAKINGMFEIVQRDMEYIKKEMSKAQ